MRRPGPWWDLSRYTSRYDRLSHRVAMGETLKPWDQFYYDTFDPHEWWTKPFHRYVLLAYIPVIIFAVWKNYGAF